LILVTGGNGYVGRALCQKLTKSGKDVASLSRKYYETHGYKSLVADVSDNKSLETIFDQYPVETIVHLASMLNTDSRQHPDKAVRVNVMGSLNLMELSRERGANRFIFGSSFNAIGDRKGLKTPVDETEASQPSEFYGETKRFVEQLGISMSVPDKFEFVSARMAIIVGPGEPSPTSAWRTDMFNLLPEGGNIKITFSPNETIPLAHYQDVADSIMLLIEAERVSESIYNLYNESWLVSDLAEFLRSLSGSLHVSCGDRELEGIPPFVSCSRFESEFKYQPVILKERFRKFMEGLS